MTKEEEKFINFLSSRRQKKQSIRDYMSGGSMGILIGLGVIICVGSGWYQRAFMIANASLSPIVLIICLLALSVFLGYFHYQYSWDNNEKKYQQIMNKEKKKADSEMNQNQPS